MFFFEKGAVRFFNSTILSRTYGDFFVTGEQYDDEPRRYTVRRIMPDGSIDSVGAFQAYPTRSEAFQAAKEANKAERDQASA